MRSGFGYFGFGPFTILVLLIWLFVTGLKGVGGIKGIGNALWESLKFRVRRYCYNCHDYRRFVKSGGPIRGFITLILIFVTGGKWLLFLPFYKKRCIKCGLPAEKARLLSPADRVGIRKID
jgi:hypothetical protein